MCSLMGTSLAVFQKICRLIHVFWLKMQKHAVFKKNGFELSFIFILSSVGNRLV